MTRFVVTYAYNEWDVNGCIGVYENANEAMGAIIANVLDLWDGRHEKGKDPKFTFEFEHDRGYDNYYDVTITMDEESEPDIYRVYYLRE